jgi:protein involved in polysaccharide export with SLBB domain
VRTATTIEYSLSATLAGREDANPLLSAGDRILVPETELIFVVGNDFSKRQAYREGMTLTQAIGPANGAAPYSDLVRVRIQRNPAAGPQPKPFILSLKAVLDHQSEDPVLAPRDIIEISDEAGNFRSRLTNIWGDPPLMHPDKEPPLVQRRSSNS